MRPTARMIMWIVVGSLLVVTMGLAANAWGFLAPSESGIVHNLDVRLIGIACGSHLAVDPNFLEANQGDRIRIVNHSPWPHQLHISTRDEAVTSSDSGVQGKVIASVTLQAGEVWDVDVPRKPGDYFVVSGNPWHHLAGLRGRIRVH